MRGLVYILMFFCFHLSLFAQTEKVEHIKLEKEADIVTFVGQEASFDEKHGSLMTYISRSIVYPQKALDNIVEGKVYVKFIVEIDGSITNVSVVKGIKKSPECDLEAMRVISQMPKWIPAKNGDELVRSWNQLPIKFSLN